MPYISAIATPAASPVVLALGLGGGVTRVRMQLAEHAAKAFMVFVCQFLVAETDNVVFIQRAVDFPQTGQQLSAATGPCLRSRHR